MLRIDGSDGDNSLKEKEIVRKEIESPNGPS